MTDLRAERNGEAMSDHQLTDEARALVRWLNGTKGEAYSTDAVERRLAAIEQAAVARALTVERLAAALASLGIGHWRGWDGCNASSHMGLNDATGAVSDHNPDAEAILAALAAETVEKPCHRPLGGSSPYCTTHEGDWWPNTDRCVKAEAALAAPQETAK